jgi:hypothetical protein
LLLERLQAGHQGAQCGEFRRDVLDVRVCESARRLLSLETRLQKSVDRGGVGPVPSRRLAPGENAYLSGYTILLDSSATYFALLRSSCCSRMNVSMSGYAVVAVRSSVRSSSDMRGSRSRGKPRFVIPTRDSVFHWTGSSVPESFARRMRKRANCSM